MWVYLVVFACSVNFINCIDISPSMRYRDTALCKQYAPLYMDEMIKKYKDSTYPIIMSRCKWRLAKSTLPRIF